MDDRPRSRLSVWRLVGWIVTILALGFIIRWLLRLDHTVWQSLLHLRLWWVIGGLAVFQVWFLLRFLAWEVIVRRHGSELQRHQTLRSWTISELMRYVPGNVWSFAAKYRSSVTAGANPSGAIQALVVEAFGLLSGAALISALFLDPQRWWWVALGIVVLLPLATPWIFVGVAKLLHWKDVPRVSLTESLVLLLWYCFVWLVFGLASAMIYHSFPALPTITYARLIGINVAAWLVGYISIITPMGLGVREVTFVKLVAGTLTNAAASLVALVTRVVFVISELIFLGIVLTWYGVKRRG